MTKQATFVEIGALWLKSHSFSTNDIKDLTYLKHLVSTTNIRNLTLSLLVVPFSSADNLCKQSDSDQDRQNVGPDLDPNHMTL